MCKHEVALDGAKGVIACVHTNHVLFRDLDGNSRRAHKHDPVYSMRPNCGPLHRVCTAAPPSPLPPKALHKGTKHVLPI